MPVNAIASPSVSAFPQGATPASPEDHDWNVLAATAPAVACAEAAVAPPRVARSTSPRALPLVAMLQGVPRNIDDFSAALKAKLDTVVQSLREDCRALIDITAFSPFGPAAALRARAVSNYLTQHGIEAVRIGINRKDEPRFYVSYGNMATGIVRISKIPVDGEPCPSATSSGG